MPKPPLDLIKEVSYNRTPIMYGHCKDEGMYRVTQVGYKVGVTGFEEIRLVGCYFSYLLARQIMQHPK